MILFAFFLLAVAVYPAFAQEAAPNHPPVLFEEEGEIVILAWDDVKLLKGDDGAGRLYREAVLSCHRLETTDTGLGFKNMGMVLGGFFTLPGSNSYMRNRHERRETISNYCRYEVIPSPEYQQEFWPRP
jgi:hypothetical protein